MRRQLVPGPVVRLTVIKAKTRPGIEANHQLVDGGGPPPKKETGCSPILSSIRSAAENHAAPIRLQTAYVMHFSTNQIV